MDYTNNPVQTYQENYNAFGIVQGAPLWTSETELASGLIPNLDSPLSASALQKGTPFISEINMQKGVIYAGVDKFPINVTNALQSQQSGYRLGLDSRDSNIPKFYIGGNNNFLFWDGLELIISGQLRVYGFDNRIIFYDQNQIEEGFIFASTSGMIIDSVNTLLIESGKNIDITATDSVLINAGATDMMLFNSALAIPAIDALVPFGLAHLTADPATAVPGQMYYNTTTGNIRAFVGLVPAWVTVV